VVPIPQRVEPIPQRVEFAKASPEPDPATNMDYIYA